MVEYVETRQTWTMVTPARRAPAPASGEVQRSSTHAVNGADELRFRAQQTRIERCMSVFDVATAVKCDAKQISDFERGDGLLRDDVEKRLRTLLRL